MVLATRHTGIVVHHLERSIQFYEALGLKLWRREKESGSYIDTVVGISGVSLEWAKMKCPDGSVVELLQYHSPGTAEMATPTPSNRPGCSHIAFTVDNIEHACSEIARLGGSVVNPPAVAPNGQVRVAYCHDTDGTLLEVVQESARAVFMQDTDAGDAAGKGLKTEAPSTGAPCPVCKSREYKIAYEGPIRDGLFGKSTDHPVKVLECVDCRLQKLDSSFLGIEEYSSDAYRVRYNDTSEVKKLLAIHDPEQADRLKLIGVERLRDRAILDYGCGHGSFLDAVSGVAGATYGVEPFEGMWHSLQQRGHRVFRPGAEALATLRGKMDIVTCFGVVEHVQDPAALVRDCFDLLSPGGCLYLQTDNLQEILMVTAAKGFPGFFYRTAHTWYFAPENTQALVRAAGFQSVSVSTTHEFDFSNFLRWHREGKPTGLGTTTLFGKPFDGYWRASVEEGLFGNLITVVATKS